MIPRSGAPESLEVALTDSLAALELKFDRLDVQCAIPCRQRRNELQSWAGIRQKFPHHNKLAHAAQVLPKPRQSGPNFVHGIGDCPQIAMKEVSMLWF